MPIVKVDMKLPVRVLTFNMNNDELEQEWIVDYATPDGRQRIARHAGWAMNNRKSVTTEPVVDAD